MARHERGARARNPHSARTRARVASVRERQARRHAGARIARDSGGNRLRHVFRRPARLALGDRSLAVRHLRRRRVDDALFRELSAREGRAVQRRRGLDRSRGPSARDQRSAGPNPPELRRPNVLHLGDLDEEAIRRRSHRRTHKRSTNRGHVGGDQRWQRAPHRRARGRTRPAPFAPGCEGHRSGLRRSRGARSSRPADHAA